MPEPVTVAVQQFVMSMASKSASAGQPGAFILATLCCVIGALTGPVFLYSDTWQMVINTGTNALTFVAVFSI